MRAETEEELKEIKTEKEALQSALRLIAGENTQLREISTPQPEFPTFSRSHSRSSSLISVKSRPESLVLTPSYPPLPPSPSPDDPAYQEDGSGAETAQKRSSAVVSPVFLSPEEESQPTPRYHVPTTPPRAHQDDPYMDDPSPWADVPSKAPLPQPPAAFADIR